MAANQSTQVLFWRLIIHPKSFSRSVENLFHVSFLVKEGKVRVFAQENQLFIGDFSYFHPIELYDFTSQNEPHSSESQAHQQYCFSITMDSWRVMATLNI